ncbi:MAG: O-antigen ligase family protein, partial [Candidatus Methylomirabilales bacterium]
MRHLERALCWAVVATVFFLPVSEALKNIAYVLCLLLYLAIIVTRREGIVVPPIGWLFLGFLGATILSAAASAYPEKAIKGIWEAFRYTSFFFIVERGVREERHVRALLWAAVTGLGLTALVTLFRHLVLGLPEWPVLSLGGNNAAAQYALMGLAVMFGIYVHVKPAGWPLFVLITVAVLNIILVGIMHARMIWGGFILVGLILGWLRSARVALTALAVSVLIVLGVAAVDSGVRSQVVSLGKVENLMYIGGLQEGARVHIWKRAIAMWRDAPWLGVGPRAFMLNPDIAEDPQRSKYGFPGEGQVHNLWLHTAVEMGSVGVFVLVLVFGYLGYWLL